MDEAETVGFLHPGSDLLERALRQSAPFFEDLREQRALRDLVDDDAPMGQIRENPAERAPVPELLLAAEKRPPG